MTRNIRLLSLHYFVSCFRPYFAFQSIYFAQIMGSYTAATAVLAMATITSALMDIPTGILSDKMGRKFTIVLASASLTLATVFYALATSGMGLFLGAAFYGLAMCLFNGNNDALLYESLKSTGEESRFHHYQGRLVSMVSLALCLSAFCASFLTGHGLRLLFILGIVPQVLSIIVALFIEEPRAHIAAPKKNLRHLKEACIKIWQNPLLRGLTIAQAFTYGAEDAKYQFQSVYFNTLWPTWALGIYLTLNQMICFVSFWFAGRVVDRVRGTLLLVVQQAYWLVSQAIALVLSNAATPVFFVTDNILFGSAMVARDHLMQKEFTDDQRATMGSVASFAASIVFSLVALGIGVISDHVSLAAGIGFGVAMSAIALPLYVGLFRKGF
jgi:MFS family permease